MKRLLVGPAEPQGRTERHDAAASLALIAAWLAAWSTSVYAVYSLAGVLVLCSTVTLLTAALWAGAACGRPSRGVVLLTVPVGLLGVVTAPPLINTELTVGSLLPAVVVGGAALLGVSLILLSKRVSPGSAAIGTLMLAGCAFGMIIVGSRPLIDVWVILQNSAGGLLDGQNPYRMHYPDVPADQKGWCFNYWPGTFLSTAPAQWLFRDVRWAEAAYLLAVPALLVWHVGQRTPGGDRLRLSLAVSVGLLPGSLLVVQQSWTEPILLLGLVGSALLIDRGRLNWAVLPLGLALATKQHLIVLLPLLLFWPRFGARRVLAAAGVAVAVSLPWALADWGRFRLCTVDFFIDQPAPPESLSVWQLVPEPARMPLLVIGFAAAAIVVLLRCPRTPAGFLLGAGTVLSAFCLLNKQTFVNQWWLAAALVVAGFALHTAQPEDTVATSRRAAGAKANLASR